ncbi:putative membrane protein [Helicobacter pylori Hp H-21]|nr:putative membrane protein [Helicobacter pylori Hp H-21]
MLTRSVCWNPGFKSFILKFMPLVCFLIAFFYKQNKET